MIWLSLQLINSMMMVKRDAFLVNPIFYVDKKGRGDDHSKAIKNINRYCREYFYSSSEAVDIEIAGFNIVLGLLDKFSVLLELNRADFQKLVDSGDGKDIARRIFLKLPRKLVGHYSFATRECTDTEEWFERVRLVVDYISGMTDDFALKVYKLFNGIEVEIL